MKIFTTLITVFISLLCFSESFDLNKFNQLKKSNDKQLILKYCAESTPTTIGIQNKQHFFAIRYLIGKQNKKFTKDQVVQIVKPFVSVSEKDLTKDMIYFIAFESAGLTDDSNKIAEQIYKKYNVKLQFGMIANRLIKNKQYEKANEIANKYNLIPIQLKLAKINKDYKMLWNISSKILCYKSGVKNPKVATEMLNNMFRYKPKDITKQEQVELIEKLSKIYPVSGTDFNEWKNFISLISYKYKVLTGKSLK